MKATEKQIDNLVSLMDGYIEKRGPHLNINVFSKETLLDAQAHPEKHRQLVVRIWGWSAYFVELDAEYQNHVLRRQQYQV